MTPILSHPDALLYGGLMLGVGWCVGYLMGMRYIKRLVVAAEARGTR